MFRASILLRKVITSLAQRSASEISYLMPKRLLMLKLQRGMAERTITRMIASEVWRQIGPISSSWARHSKKQFRWNKNGECSYKMITAKSSCQRSKLSPKAIISRRKGRRWWRRLNYLKIRRPLSQTWRKAKVPRALSINWAQTGPPISWKGKCLD